MDIDFFLILYILLQQSVFLGQILSNHPNVNKPVVDELEVGRLGEAVRHEGEHCGQHEEGGQVHSDDGLELDWL